MMLGNVTMPAFDKDADIRKLLRTIAKLMREAPGEWFSSRRVSREQEGTEEFAEYLEELSLLPEWRDCFARAGKRVKLTEKGIRRADGLSEPRLSMTQAIASAVREYAKTLRRLPLNVIGIATVARSAKQFIQAVRVEIDESLIPSETPIDFRPTHRGAITRGRVVGQEHDGGILYIAFDTQVLEADLPAVITVDRGFLLHQLGQQLDRLQGLPPLVESMVTPKSTSGIPLAHLSAQDVAHGLASVQPPWMRFLWGPPGSGKTFALAHLATQLLRGEADGRILLVAPSNRAVDVATEQLVTQIEASDLRGLIGERRILRFGYPRRPQVLERPELLGPPDLDMLTAKAQRISAAISKAEQGRKSEADLAVLRAELLSVQEEVKAAVDEHVQHSRVVATTTALAYLESSPIWRVKWTTVLVDEATMVPPAICTFLGSLPSSRLLLAGDPRQLGPIYEESPDASSRAREWMGRDIFEAGGVSRGAGQSRTIATNDSRLAQITSQRRCAPNIWATVRHLYPPTIQSTIDPTAVQLSKLPPLPGEALAVLDTSDPRKGAKCERVHRSWQNHYTAALAMEVSGTVMSEAPSGISMAIISPYRAQVGLLRKWIRGERPYNAMLASVEAGTVHQFQGSDADVVIFDIVDGIGRSGLGSLLQGDAGIRLVNVAVTRAKGKVVVLADRSWFRERVRREDNPLLWDLVVETQYGERLAVSPPGSEEQPFGPESPIEVELYEAMMKDPDLCEVQVQYVIRNDAGWIVSRADFAFPKLKYAIYCDGAQWHLRPDRWQRDLRQRNELTALGWVFSVFSGSEVKRDAAACAAKVSETRRRLLS